MPPFLHDADLQLLHLINRVWTNAVLDRVMATVTDFGAWAPVMIGVAVLALCVAGAVTAVVALATGALTL